MPSINTYLTFNGNCEKAFEFYKSVFGGNISQNPGLMKCHPIQIIL